MDAVAWLKLVASLQNFLVLAVALCALASPWPRRFWVRCTLAVALGWIAFVFLTVAAYNPAGIAAGRALGAEFPESQYDNNTTAAALLLGWLYPALLVGLFALGRFIWRRVKGSSPNYSLKRTDQSLRD